MALRITRVRSRGLNSTSAVLGPHQEAPDRKDYEAMMRMAIDELKLDTETLSNLKELTPKRIVRWTGEH